MSEYIINDEWIREYERNIEELIGCDLDYDGYNNPVPPLRKVNTKSRYSELFGTPERSARTLSVTAKCFEPATACRECIYKGFCDTQCDYDALLEWLRGESE